MFCQIKAQKPRGLAERVIANNVIIYNNSNSEITISIGENLQKLNNYKINAQAKWISPKFEENPIIKIKSNKHIAEFILEKSITYMIFWNKTKKYWDLNKIEN